MGGGGGEKKAKTCVKLQYMRISTYLLPLFFPLTLPEAACDMEKNRSRVLFLFLLYKQS